jgi:hypothetical protein
MRPTVDIEIAAIIPALSAAELAGLRESLLDEGCRDALVVWYETGILLDGHNRLAICEVDGIPYRTIEISLPDRLAATIWVLRNQLGRRNLTDDQRAMMAAGLAELLSTQAKTERAKVARAAVVERHPMAKPDLRTDVVRKSEPPDRDNRSDVQAATAMGVSERKVRQAQAVRQEAPELAAEVAAGVMRLPDAVPPWAAPLAHAKET